MINRIQKAPDVIARLGVLEAQMDSAAKANLTLNLGLSSAVAGLYLSVTQTAGMIGTPIAGSISDRSGRKRVLTAGLFSTSVVLFVLAYFQLDWFFVTGLAFLGFFLYAVRPVIWAWVLDQPQTARRQHGELFLWFSVASKLAVAGDLRLHRRPLGHPHRFLFSRRHGHGCEPDRLGDPRRSEGRARPR
jgi:MFS family permease